MRASAPPLVTCHGDYWAGNVLVERGRVSGVVDWNVGPSTAAAPGPGQGGRLAAYCLDRYRPGPRGPAALPEWGDLGPWTGIGDPRFATGFRAAFVQLGCLRRLARHHLTGAFGALIPLAWLPVAVVMYLRARSPRPPTRHRRSPGGARCCGLPGRLPWYLGRRGWCWPCLSWTSRPRRTPAVRRSGTDWVAPFTEADGGPGRCARQVDGPAQPRGPP